MLPGVVMLHPAPPQRLDMLRAALVYAGPQAVVTGSDACVLHGLRNVPTRPTVHVLVPDHYRYGSTSWLKVERTIRLPEPVLIQGIPVAPMPRAAIDFARFSRDDREVTAAFTEVVQRRKCSVRRMSDELEAGSDFGSARPRRVLAALGGAHSVAEAEAMEFLRATDMPDALWNRDVVDSSGRWLGRPDAWFDDVALAWEIDSVEYHLDKDAYAATMAKHTRMTAAGVIVVHTLPSWLKGRPEMVRDELRQAYVAAQRRPRPEVRVLPAPD